MSKADFIAVLPILIMACGSIAVLLLDLVPRGKFVFPRLGWCCGICAMAWVLSLSFLRREPTESIAFDGLLSADPYCFVFYSLILGGAALTLFLSDEQQKPQGITAKIDVDVLMLLAATGGMVMVSAANLIVLFLGFELLSISVYVLTGLARKERASAEGSLKYFVLGAFSSAFLLYGMVLVYAATGSMEYNEIAANASLTNPVLLIGVGLILFGFGFKVALVPFHFWTPDVYQGAPVSITAFMAVVVKAAAFGAFFRLMISAFGGLSEAWVGLLWLVCLASMTLGNLVALRQKSVKRMLAYSSIAHAGYALMGFLALGAAGGGEALLFYLLAYALMTLAAFGVVLVVTAGSEAQYDNDDIESFQGIGWSHPFLGLVMTIALLSLAGVPPLAGFMGKFYLFQASVRAGFVGLTIIAALNSVVSLYYYLRVVMVMFFSGERTLSWSPEEKIVFGPRVALALVTIGIILVGLFPVPYLGAARHAVRPFFGF